MDNIVFWALPMYRTTDDDNHDGNDIVRLTDLVGSHRWDKHRISEALDDDAAVNVELVLQPGPQSPVQVPALVRERVTWSRLFAYFTSEPLCWTRRRHLHQRSSIMKVGWKLNSR